MTPSISLRRIGVIGTPMLLAVVVLAGCGGGSSEVGTPPTAAAPEAVPPTASASVQALFDFQRGLAASDGAEPLTTSGLLLPVSDTTEPFGLN